MGEWLYAFEQMKVDYDRLTAETAAQQIVISKLNHEVDRLNHENDALRAELAIAVQYEITHKLRAGDFTLTVETGVQE